MTLSGLLIPDDERVAVAWVRQYVGPDLGNAGVSTKLPKTLPEDGFITCTLLRPGIALVDLPVHKPLVTFDFWTAPSANGGRPRWGNCAQLVARVTRAMDNDFQTFGKPLDLGDEFMGARVQAVYKDNEPRRVTDDPNAYARYTLDVNVDWLVI